MEDLTSKQKIAAVVFVSLAIIGLFSGLVWWLVSEDDSTSSDDCTTPDPVPSEYNLTNVTGSPSKAGFSITGVECAAGFTGTPIATACSVAGQPYTLSPCSADSTNSPCSLSTLTQPTNGSWGTTCSSNSGEIQHGASCDLGCNTGYTPSNQPTCNDGVLSSTTLTCTGGSTGDSTNSPCSLSTLTQPTNGSWGTICPSNSGEIQHGASCDLGCNTGYTPSNQPTCNNGVLSSTTLTCTPQLNPPFYLGGLGEKCSDVCLALGKTCSNNEIEQGTFFNDGQPGHDFFSRSCVSPSISINSSDYNSMGPLYATAGNNNQCKYQAGSTSLCNTNIDTLSTSRRICKCVDQ